MTIVGTIAEGSDLAQLSNELTATTVVDLADIERITSPGIRDWNHFIAAAEARGVKFVFVRCCPVVVEQINLVREFLGHGLVKSFYAPYACSRCGMEQRLLVESRDLKQPKAPACNCPRCNEPMVFDSIEESYFGFVKDPNKVVTDDRFDALVPPEPPQEQAPVPTPVAAKEPSDKAVAPPLALENDSVPSNPSVHEIPPFTPPVPAAAVAPVAAPPQPRQIAWAVWLLVGVVVVCAIAWLL